jgi:hypothetical protein
LKTLAKLILIAGIGLSSLSLHSEDFKAPHETNKYKFIPQGAVAEEVRIKTQLGFIYAIWYDEDCKTKDDYSDKWIENEGKVSGMDLFLDLDGDEILDVSMQELNDLYAEYLQEQETEKTML